MDVSPKTIREVEFREKLRGYNPDDVDEFLERVAAGIEILQERMRQATERAVRAEQRITEVGEGDDTMRRTLVLAQRTADLAVQEARDQAAQIVAQAEVQAQSIRGEAAEHARRTIDDATREAWAEVARLETVRDRLRGEIVNLEHFLDNERGRLRAALHEALRRVDDAVPSLGEPPPATEVGFGSTHRVEPPAPAAVPPAAAAMPPPPPPPAPSMSSPSHDAAPMTATHIAAASSSLPPPPAPPLPRAEVSGLADDDDTFLAELRMAVNDTSPLGPRDEGHAF